MAILGFPAAVIGSREPAWKVPAIVAIAALAGAAIIDAALRGRALAGLRVELPELARFFKDRTGEIRVRVHNESGRRRAVRVGMVAPDGLDAPIEEQLVDLPDSAPTAEFAWSQTPR